MKLVFHADECLTAELRARSLPPGVRLERVEKADLFNEHPDADLIFDLSPSGNAIENYQNAGKPPILINAVSTTLSQYPGLKQVVRLNAWPGMLSRPMLELAAGDELIQSRIAGILDALNWSYRFVPDIPGMVSARIIAMIINEAFFALGEGVSSRDEIDIAMKTGTNYPWGPFEWTKKIGAHRVLELLHIMNKQNQRYSIAPALVEEATR